MQGIGRASRTKGLRLLLRAPLLGQLFRLLGDFVIRLQWAPAM
jgi:hypothetical protein